MKFLLSGGPGTIEGRSAMFLERLRRRGRAARPLLPATRGAPSEEAGWRPARIGEWSGFCVLVLRSQTARAVHGGVVQTQASGWQAWTRPQLPALREGRRAGGRGGGTGRARPVRSSHQGLEQAEATGELQRLGSGANGPLAAHCFLGLSPCTFGD